VIYPLKGTFILIEEKRGKSSECKDKGGEGMNRVTATWRSTRWWKQVVQTNFFFVSNQP
jgi:hypothetical protein